MPDNNLNHIIQAQEVKDIEAGGIGLERRSEVRKRAGEFYSAEFSIDGLDVPYQFKIWNFASASMCVLVKENSELLPRLRVGDTLLVKYYSNDSSHLCDCQKTAIRHITKSDQGRLKGHYLVGLEILEC